MRRVACVVLIGSALAGCSSVSLPEAGGYELAGKANDGRIEQATKYGLGAGQTVATATTEPGEVAVDSSAKAPKGALADRDYSSTRLDPQTALDLINTYRKTKGLKPLKLDPRLTQAAKAHSRDLAKSDRISHYGSDGSSPWDRVKRAGYPARLAAENVGTGQASLEEVVQGWEQSPSHNKNLLLADARDMGIALVEDPRTEFKTFWTLVVGTAD